MKSPTQRLLGRALAAVVVATSLLRGAPLFAPPMSGDPDKFKELQAAWEAETGRKSRITLYAAIGDVELPAWMNPATMQIVQAAWLNPFEADLTALKPVYADFEPGFALMEEARALEDCGRFQEELNSPTPHFPRVVATAQMLSCRAQQKAKDGDLDGAIHDLTSIWIMGRSFETGAGTLPTVKKSLAMRGLSSQLLMALVRKYDLNAEQRATLRSILLKDAPKDDESSSLRAMARDHEYVSDMVRQSPLKQDGEKMEKTSADLKEALDKMSLPTPGKRFAQSDEYEKSAAEAAKYYQASQAYSFPMRQVLVHENIALAMERMCVLATLVLDANEAAEDGHADDEAIAALAKEFPNQLLDPFTDNPLVVVNKGGKQFAIVSAGPDMKLSAPRRWAPYTPAMGPNGAGDVILYRIALPGSEKVSAEPAVDPEEALVEPAAEPAAEDDATAASGENPAAEAP